MPHSALIAQAKVDANAHLARMDTLVAQIERSMIVIERKLGNLIQPRQATAKRERKARLDVR
jgi:hypothetical protein